MLKISKKILVISASLLLMGCGNNQTKDDENSSIAICPFLTVKTQPIKTNYNCGNNFDPSGMVVEFTGSDGSKRIIDDYVLSNDKNVTADQTSVTISYDNFETKVRINVSDVLEGQITCVGDSLTEGHSWPTESYPNYIKGNFEDSSLMTVSNCGKNGASFKTFGQYNPAYNTTEQYQTSLTGNPVVLTILLGTNDATNWTNEKDLYVQDYTDLVNTYRTTFGDQLNIIMLTSPRCLSNAFGIPSDTICNEVVPLQKQLADELGCYLIDLNGEFEKYTDDELFRPNDGVHFTKQAAEITASLISCKIKEIYEL